MNNTKPRNTFVRAACVAVVFATAVVLEGAPEKPGIVSMPDQPVSAESLPPAELAAFRAPMVVEIVPQKIGEPVGPLSFTSGSSRGMLNQISEASGFEPMAFRPKLRPIADSMDSVILGPRFVSEFKEGFLDGCRVRVYHPVNGKMMKVRDATVAPGGHHASGWTALGGGVTAGPDGTEYQQAMGLNFRPGAPFWFKIVGVNQDGAESAESEVIQAVLKENAPKNAKGSEPIGRVKYNTISRNLPVPPRVEGFALAESGGVFTFTWKPSPSEGLLGYRIYMTSYDPAQHKGYELALASREPMPDQKIQAGDIVFVDLEMTRADQQKMCSNDDWANWSGPRAPKGFKCYSDEAPTHEWAFVPHPGALPEEFFPRGKTCLMLRNDEAEPVGVQLLTHGGSDQTFYPVLEAKPCRVEAWVKGEGAGSLEIAFAGPYSPPGQKIPFSRPTKPGENPKALGPLPLPLSAEWHKVTVDFAPKEVIASGLGQVYLSFQGPGKVYVDNLRIFDPSHPAGDCHPIILKSLGDSGMSLMRTHELIKTANGYTLEGMTEDTGGNNYSGFGFNEHTFTTLLRTMKLGGGVSPWLQVEMCLDEDEWRGFMEWLAAPYDPAKDSPTTKPWAYKRWRSGQQQPWLDEFPRFAFELSNETWNGLFAPYAWESVPLRDGATGFEYSKEETYGLFQEYAIQRMKSSPSWTDALEEKTLWVLGGWGPVRFANGARFHSPSSEIVTYASYNHNEGLGPIHEVNDFKRFYLMQWPLSAIQPAVGKEMAAEKAMRRMGFPVESGVYEYGFAYHSGTGFTKEEREADQRFGRNLPMAAAILDGTLVRAQAGHAEQSFFTWGFTIHTWGSHTKVTHGGHAYPTWKALSLFNHHGTGAFLETRVKQVPTWDFPEYETMDNMSKRTRPALPDAPLVSAYATADKDRVTVMLISRKLDNFPISGDDGFTPVTLELPMKSVEKITLHRLTGDTRADGRFKDHHPVETVPLPASAYSPRFRVNKATGMDDRGLPPASITFYVFEGKSIGDMNAMPYVDFAPPDGFTAGSAAHMANLSADPDGDTLAYEWSLAELGASKEKNPEVLFKDARPRTVRLAVTDSRGGTRTEERVLQVPIAHAGLPLALGVTGRNPQAVGGAFAAADGGELVLSGACSFLKGDRLYAGSMEEVAGNFVWETEVTEIVPAPNPKKYINGMSPGTAGIVLGQQSFNSDMDWQFSPLEGLVVGKDGLLRAWSGGGKPLADQTPYALPVKLRVSVEDGKGVFSVWSGGKWKPVHEVSGLPYRVFPGLSMSSGNPDELGAARFKGTLLRHNVGGQAAMRDPFVSSIQR